MYLYISVQLLQYGSTALLWDPDLRLVMEAVEKRGLKDISNETAQALRQFFTQVYSLQIIPLFSKILEIIKFSVCT